MPLPEKLTPYEILRGIESTLTFTAAQLDELIGTQPDTALEGMLLSALAAVTGARASLADVRLNWEDLSDGGQGEHQGEGGHHASSASASAWAAHASLAHTAWPPIIASAAHEARHALSP